MWARMERELFFIDGTGTLIAVPLQESASFKRGPEVPLFAARHYFVDTARNYDVAKDGTRFLFVKNVTSVPPLGRRRHELVQRSSREDGSTVGQG